MTGVPASPSGLRPFGVEPPSASQARPLVPNAAHGATNVHFSSASDLWATPQTLFNDLSDRLGPFDLDPCATAENAKCRRFFTASDDGLAQEWRGRVFMNPPYGRAIRHWMRKAYESSLSGATVVCLVPSRTDTAWWHDFAAKGEVEFIRGRLRFGSAKKDAPFPCAIVIFRPASAMSAFGQDPKGLEARPASATRKAGDAK